MKNLKKALSLLLSLMLVLGAVSVGGVSVSADGDGIEFNEADNRYEISNYAGLKKFADFVNGENGETQNSSACAKLMNDINASASAENNDWTPIGNDNCKYTGVFDGDGHVITGLTFNDSSADFVGLFGYVGTKTEGGITTKGIVENVGLEGGKITDGYYAGGVAGHNEGTITNCYNTGDVTLTGSSNWFYAGGVVGFNRGTITNCYNTGDVTVTETGSANYLYSGGVVGFNIATITNCYNTGDVTETGSANYLYSGGVVGFNITTITNCYNTGDVTVTGTASYISTGGVAGYNGGEITNCYYDRTAVKIDGVSEDNNWKAIGNSEIATVKGLTTEAMTAGTYTDGDSGYVSNMPGFSSDTWLVRKPDIFGEYYPHLRGFEYDNTGVVADWPAHILSQNGNTADNPYEIETYAQLKDFASIVNKENNSACAKLMNDIEFINEDGTVAKDWTPIGYCEHDETGKVTFDAAFIGTFDGDGHVITGLTCNDSSAEYAGLFGYVDAKSDTVKGTVKNVGLESGSINGGSYAGGVVGYNNGGTVQNCYNTSNVSGSDCAGGVVGYNNGGTVQSCYNTGDVSGSDYVGGVVGYNNGGTVTNCYNTGDVSGNGDVGGVAGDSGSPDGIKKVDNCYYDKSVCGNIGAVCGADIDTEDNKVKGLTTAQMTGRNAISYDHEDIDIHPMYFNYDAESPWLTKDDGADEASGEYYWYYPQLKGFNKKADGTPETDPSKILPSDWPAKAEVTAALSEYSFEYDGLPHIPTVTSIKVGGKTLEQGSDYTVKYYKLIEAGWSSDPVDPIDAGEYKAAVKFTASGHKPIEKEYKINTKSVTVTAASEEFTYDGTAHSNNGYEVRGLVGSDAITAVVTGSITYPSESPVPNVIESYSFTSGSPDNYNVTTVNGELTMSNASKEITITSASREWTYDGSAHSDNTVTVTGGSLFEGDELVAEATGSVTNVSDTAEGNNIIADGYKIMHGDKDVTENYVITAVNGTLTINPAKVTVTITGKHNSAPYDGREHTVSDYNAESSNPLYRCTGETLDYNFTGTAKARRTDAGTTYMGLTDSQFVNKNANFDVTFDVTDGYQTIVPISVDVTVKGNSATADYDGNEKSVTGYTATASSDLYDVENDIEFSGTAEAKRTEPGTENMGLSASQFTNSNENFNVTFTVEEDGKLTVNPVIRFVNEDGTELQSGAAALGSTPGYTGSTPEKAASDGNTYEFAGWSPEITAATENATYTATYKAVPIKIDLGEFESTTGYKEEQTFTVDTSDLPEGAEVHWFINSEDVGTGESYTVEDPTDDYTVQAKVVDKDGNVIAESEEQKVEVKNGFFDRLKAFFAELIEKILGKAIADLLSSVC